MAMNMCEFVRWNNTNCALIKHATANREAILNIYEEFNAWITHANINHAHKKR